MLPVLGVLALLSGACSGDAKPTTDPAKSTTTIGPGAGPEAVDATPQPSAKKAAEALLTAEMSGDHAGSYRLLTSAGRKGLTPAAWARRRSEVPVITGFSIEKVDGATVVTLVDHEPGLDPFVGLSPAQERQTWRAHKEGAGWLLEPEPTVKALYPSPVDAPAVALTWARALQACDTAAVHANQAVDVLFGTSDAPDTLCKTTPPLAVSGPESVEAGPASQELVAQYGTDALDWGRAVGVTGGPRPFHVVLAPIGSVWRVVGVFEP